MIENNKLSSKRAMTIIGIALFSFTAIPNIVQYIAILVIKKFKITLHGIDETLFSFVFSAICLYLIAFPIYYFIMKRVPVNKPNGNRKYTLFQIIKLFAICYASAILFNYISIGINYLLSLLKGGNIINPLEQSIQGASPWAILFFACILAPLMEEIIFRKILINRLNRFGGKVAIIISAYAFALAHGNLSQMLYAFVLGVIFGYITIATGSVKYSIILHMLVNFTGSLLPMLILKLGESATAILGLAMLALVAGGVATFIAERKKLFPKLCEGEETNLNSETDNVIIDANVDNAQNMQINPTNDMTVKKAITNVGMLLYLLLSIAMIVLVIIE